MEEKPAGSRAGLDTGRPFGSRRCWKQADSLPLTKQPDYAEAAFTSRRALLSLVLRVVTSAMDTEEYLSLPRNIEEDGWRHSGTGGGARGHPALAVGAPGLSSRLHSKCSEGWRVPGSALASSVVGLHRF